MKNWFDRMFRTEPDEDWRLVNTHELTWKKTGTDGTTVLRSGTVFAHMFESNKGNRYVKLISAEVFSWLSEEKVTIHNHAEIVARVRKELQRSILSSHITDAQVCEFVLTNEDWNATVYPWLAGRMDPKIPTYAEVPKREFADALAGKKS
jgi:hypothetical protein